MAVATEITGVNHIDALLAGANARWNASSDYGTASSLTFSFMTASPSTATGNEITSFQAFNTTQKAGARAALAQFAEVANLTFAETTDSSSVNIRFASDNQNNVSAGYAYYPGSSIGGQVWLASDDSNNYDMTVGGYGYMTMLHEIGHAVGLKHPGNYNAGDTSSSAGDPPFLPAAEDNYSYTLMSYNSADGGLNASTLMLYDISALQYLYGANTATRSGNDTYVPSAAATMLTVWDGGGTDTIDASAQTLGAAIDLRAGAFSSVGALPDGSRATNNLAIAYNVTIENAIGGSGSDTIVGNALANRLDGGAGNDRINTQGGNDTVFGGAGSDWLDLGAGGGTVQVSGIETLVGGTGQDWVSLADGGNALIVAAVETLVGGAGQDNVTLGNRGNTMIVAGVETLVGGTGQDFVTLGNRGGALTLSSVETLLGGTGQDSVTLAGSGNTLILAAIETLVGSGGTDVVSIGNRGISMTVSGVETILGGTGADNVTLTGGATYFRGGRGADTLTLSTGNAVEQVAFGNADNGGDSGANSGYDDVFNFQTGTDQVIITNALRALVDHNGDGTLTVAQRNAGTADFRTDDLIVLTARPATLVDDGFAAMRQALGTVATGGSPSSALVLATNGTNSALYWIGDGGDGIIAAEEVRMLARFRGSVLAGTDFRIA